MNVISLHNHVQISQKQKKEVNDLVAKCFEIAAQRMGSMRGVLQGDMSTVSVSKSSKAA